MAEKQRRKPGPKPSEIRKTPIRTYIEQPTMSTFDETVRKLGISKVEAFNEALQLWLKTQQAS